MNELEKLYTIEDIVMITSLTPQTVKDCLKDDILKGHKIDGQYRFTKSDVKAFLNNELSEAIKKEKENYVLDFLNAKNVNMLEDGKIMACSMLNFNCESLTEANKIKDKLLLMTVDPENCNKINIDFKFFKSKSTVVFTIISTSQVTEKIIHEINEFWR